MTGKLAHVGNCRRLLYLPGRYKCCVRCVRMPRLSAILRACACVRQRKVKLSRRRVEVRARGFQRRGIGGPASVDKGFLRAAPAALSRNSSSGIDSSDAFCIPQRQGHCYALFASYFLSAFFPRFPFHHLPPAPSLLTIPQAILIPWLVRLKDIAMLKGCRRV